ncbi:MAG: tRNA (5-methylaminomethyl-2-thiouridine)(34)-methyltransferase MnmD [Saprospiraceae bacterium]|nr:tRNA (5-methylaminomethyl-2-thiouridine)(34)-methyltransferase MnmD [Saprospiraceae bacterium]
MSDQKVISEDGFHTISSSAYGVTYHSIYGALNESITVFLSAGLQFQILKGKKKISIFEMGLGTGLNALLTLIDTADTDIHIDYTAIELHPLKWQDASELNYINELNGQQWKPSFQSMHTCPADQYVDLTSSFRFRKYHGDLLTTDIEGRYDVIYYDAFAPTAQEELWTSAVMEKMYNMLHQGGVLVTYCAKGSFKRALKSVGFKVEALPGPPGKREMTRAHK